MTLEQLVDMIRSGLVKAFVGVDINNDKCLEIQGDAGLTPHLHEGLQHLQETNHKGVCGAWAWVARNDIEVCPNEQAHRPFWRYVLGTDGKHYTCDACAEERAILAQNWREAEAALRADGRVFAAYPPTSPG